ncbi:histidine phosphatase family protein [Paenibacillus qinlingensis]|uniref:2,3-bisphosphoglycerate-dependent phosphoglycerate mutase n=1 Tax=Paenibacillus qinlingensis TaxID=1837343 RepID=A0ABU1NQG1_9BACL|nr:histidine phosphatase family protein [Paenibacillus qinlingensis]MDR6549720.1 2,3-bisphosphoglycerate-dependent phosphoglycerate mutase [Paenibacillus qinlingensis]
MMKTQIYVVRHAESLYIANRERERGLTNKGLEDALTVKAILDKVDIDVFLSSPYERAVQTIKAAAGNREIRTYEDLRERTMGDFEEINFKLAKQQVYDDFQFSYLEGESSQEAQDRAITVIKHILTVHKGLNVVIGTHGDIMTLIMNYFDPSYDYKFWETTSMPDIYRMEFHDLTLVGVKRLWERKDL